MPTTESDYLRTDFLASDPLPRRAARPGRPVCAARLRGFKELNRFSCSYLYELEEQLWKNIHLPFGSEGICLRIVVSLCLLFYFVRLPVFPCRPWPMAKHLPW